MEEQNIFIQLSTLHTTYICEHCYKIDTDIKRSTPGYKCSCCNQPGSGSFGYFPLEIFKLFSLMENFFNLEKKEISHEFIGYIPNNNINHFLFVIFFCSLAEILLTNLLDYSLKKEDIPQKVRCELLNNNLFIKQKITKLFPSLIGVKWIDAVYAVDKKSTYKATLNFYYKVKKIRNDLIHRGISSKITGELPKKCLKNTVPLVSLFIDLHNKFIAKGRILNN